MYEINTPQISLLNGGSNQDFTVVDIKLEVDALSPDCLQDLKAKDLLKLIDPTKGVILNGRAPTWLYSFLVHEFHPVGWIALNDPRLGGVVCQSHRPGVSVGDTIPWASRLMVV